MTGFEKLIMTVAVLILVVTCVLASLGIIK